ncbi:TPA: hypothetical protein HA265_03030 [Candidatus Woesearchaeota archaeon]|nr:hypothetical protein [Candidatus Woesearchaeota archaeon]
MRKHHTPVYFHLLALAIGGVGLYYLWRYAAGILQLGDSPLRWVIYVLFGALALVALGPVLYGVFFVGRASGELLPKEESDQLKAIIKKMFAETEHIVPPHHAYRDLQRIADVFRHQPDGHVPPRHPTSDDWDHLHDHLEEYDERKALRTLDVEDLGRTVHDLSTHALWWYENVEKKWTLGSIVLPYDVAHSLDKRVRESFSRVVPSPRHAKALVDHLHSAYPHLSRLKLLAEEFNSVEQRFHGSHRQLTRVHYRERRLTPLEVKDWRKFLTDLHDRLDNCLPGKDIEQLFQNYDSRLVSFTNHIRQYLATLSGSIKQDSWTVSSANAFLQSSLTQLKQMGVFCSQFNDHMKPSVSLSQPGFDDLKRFIGGTDIRLKKIAEYTKERKPFSVNV